MSTKEAELFLRRNSSSCFHPHQSHPGMIRQMGACSIETSRERRKIPWNNPATPGAAPISSTGVWRRAGGVRPTGDLFRDLAQLQVASVSSEGTGGHLWRLLSWIAAPGQAGGCPPAPGSRRSTCGWR